MPAWFLSKSPGYARIVPVPGDAFTPIAAFSTRRGGTSAAPYDSLNLSAGVGDDPTAVADNRARLLGALGLDPARVAWATQVHGATVLAPASPGLAGAGDALVAASGAVVLAVGAADCLPVLAWDGSGRAVAAAHAGWRGLVAGVLPRTLEALSRLGVAPGDLTVALGPRIGPCCFVVGPEVARRFPEDCVRPAPAAGEDRSTADLAGLARRQLAAAGVGPGALLDRAECTACDRGAYFSHRRDGGRTGRSWGVVALGPAAPAGPTETAV